MREPKHGTNSEYTNHGCRCNLCKAAHNEASKKLKYENDKLKAENEELRRQLFIAEHKEFRRA